MAFGGEAGLAIIALAPYHPAPGWLGAGGRMVGLYRIGMAYIPLHFYSFDLLPLAWRGGIFLKGRDRITA